ncbi:MAG: hypothetical protein N838_23290 [Thiohalocapsa sp. PB-PSB1]|nr:MAG: hypothetical protein N838_23290 [Thiohalocapsa sp. PB-PSB1]
MRALDGIGVERKVGFAEGSNATLRNSASGPQIEDSCLGDFYRKIDHLACLLVRHRRCGNPPWPVPCDARQTMM